MKLIDKYLLRTLFTPLSYCLAGFTMVVIIFDLFEHFSEFVDAKTPLLEVIKFYLFFLPAILIIIVPISLLLATLYALSSLTKNNELTAMRASGMSMYRLMVPFMTLGLLASLVVGTINETIAPWSAYWTDQFIKMQGQEKTIGIYTAYNLAFKNDQARRLWMIGEFDTKTYEMKNAIVTQQRPDDSDEYKIQAREGRWLDGRWWFIDATTRYYTPDGQPSGPPQSDRNREMYEFTETPKLFLSEIRDPQFFSSLELSQYMRSRNLSPDRIARHMTDLHNRLAMPWTCLIVMLLGIPFGVQTGRKGAFLGIVFALILFFAYYALINLGLALGKNHTLTPWLAGWMPNLIFFVLGLIMVQRMR